MKTSYACHAAAAILSLFGACLCVFTGNPSIQASDFDNPVSLSKLRPQPGRMPAEYRKTHRQGGKEYFYFAEAMVLGGGEWAALEIKKFDNPQAFIGGPCGTFSGRGVSKGWLAIELRTGRSLFLQPPTDRQLPKDVELGRIGFHDRLCRWRSGSCAVGVQAVSEARVKTATPDLLIRQRGMQAVIPQNQRWFLWEWQPKKGSVEPRGWFAPISNLVRALEGTPLELSSWDPPFQGSVWSGVIRIANRETGENLLLDYSDTRRRQDTKETFVDYDSRLDFGPSDDRQSVVVLDRLELDRGGPILSGIELARRPTVRWRQDRQSIEKVVGGRLKELYLVRGAERPCRFLPIIVLTKKEADSSSTALCVLDSRTGRLQGPRALPWKYSGTLFELSFEGITICASRDGRLLTYCTYALDDQEPARIQVYDIPTASILGSREIEEADIKTIGFDSAGNIILADSVRVSRWCSPFTAAREEIYALDAPCLNRAEQ